MLTTNDAPKRSEQVAYETVAGEAILIRLDTGTYFALNRVGADFWARLDGEQTIAALALAMRAGYDVDEAQLLGDLLELAGQLAAEQLIEVA